MGILNSKRFLAVTMATVMVFGSAVTAFADDGDGTGTYEGNEVEYTAPSVTVPTIVAGTYNYIADPNGLIKESNSSRYSGATWSSTAKGVFFQTETNKYTETSTPITITNKAAYAIDVVVTMAEKNPGTNVAYSADSTFANSTSKDLYLALSDGKTTSAMSQATDDNDQVTKTPATLRVSVPGRPSNFELVYSKAQESDQSATYHYAQKSTVKDTDWNSAAITATGALNTAASWVSGAGDAAIAFPAVTVTFAITAGAKPVKIQSGVDASVVLAHKAANLTITAIKDPTGATVPTNMYTATTITADAAATVTLKAAFTTYAYSKVPANGINFTVTYSDGFVETFTVLKR
jgi:Cu/Ag efflux protein CusF